jgi:hypothetical protein
VYPICPLIRQHFAHFNPCLFSQTYPMNARLPETRVPAAKVCPHAFLRVNLLLGAFYPKNKVQLATSTLRIGDTYPKPWSCLPPTLELFTPNLGGKNTQRGKLPIRLPQIPRCVQWRSEVCTDFYLNWGALEFISVGCQNCINSENSPNTCFFWDFGIRHFRLLKNSGFKQPFLDWAL